MARSGLTNNYVPASSKNYTQGRSRFGKIELITIHHTAGLKLPGGIFQDPTRAGSSHYGVKDGTIESYVDEADVAWSNGVWASNVKSVSIETVNSQIGGEWPVSEQTIQTEIKLVADIAKRNNLFPLVRGKNIIGHRDVKATTCPGPTLYGKLDYIIAEANKLIGSIKPAPQATVTPTNIIASGNKGKVKVYGSGYITNDPYIGKVASFMRTNFKVYTPKAALGNYFGPNITKAIKEFQRRTKLTVDGRFAENGETIQMLRRYGFKG